MFDALEKPVLAFLRLPERQPDPPPGGYRAMQVFRASPKWLSYRLLLFWMGAALAAAALSAAMIASVVSVQIWAAGVVGVVSLAVFVVLAFTWFCVRVEWKLRTYVVTDRSLRVREGAWVFREMTLTYANVQNVQVLQGPLQRVFGIQDLRVDTAGGGGTMKGEGHGTSGHSVTLAGLENAHEVRDRILAYVKVAGRGSGLGDLDDPEHARGATTAIAATPDVLDALRGLKGSASALRTSVERRTRPI